MAESELRAPPSRPPRAIRAVLISANVALQTVCHDLVSAWNATRPSTDIYDFSTAADQWIPYLGWTWVVYYLGDLYVLFWGAAVVWRMSSGRFYRAVIVYSAMIIIGAAVHLAFPGYSPWPENGSLVQQWFHERVTFDPNVCFPSMHVALAVLPACMTFDVFTSRTVRTLSSVFAGLITVSTLTLKEHFILDAIAGLLLALAFYAVWKKGDANDHGNV